MSYVAVTYVGKWSPGEIIGEALTDEQAGRLLRKGRIKLLVALVEKPAPEPEPAAEAAKAEEAAQEPEAEAEAEETVDAEPLEIDAADALVTAPKPKKTTKARAKK